MHLFLEKPALTLCPKCGKDTKPHMLCWNCGYYKGEQVIDVLAKLTKKEKKAKEKEMSGREEREKGDQPLTMEGLSKK